MTATAVTMRQAKGFVVVSRWTKARYQWSAPSFDVFETLDKAREELRRLQNHEIDDFAPVGIFPAFNGMPIACSVDLDTIEAVSPAPNAAPRPQPELLRVVEKLCAEGRAKRLAGELMQAWQPGEFHGREDYDRWKNGEEWTR